MTEIEPREHEIDNLLKRSMAAPIPTLAPDFDQQVMRKVNRRSQPLDRYDRVVLAGYSILSVVVSAVLMRGQGLGWGLVALTTLAPLGLVVAATSVRGTGKRTSSHAS